MNENRVHPTESEEGDTQKINSPSRMARALGLTQDPKSLHSRDREYFNDLSEKIDISVPAEKTLSSSDFHNGKLEEIHIGVRLKEPLTIWSIKSNVLSDVFLKWFVENGGDSELAKSIMKLEDPGEKGRIQKTIMQSGGYDLITKIIQQSEKLGYFEYLSTYLSGEFERKRAIAEAVVKDFLAEFPEYSLFDNCFGEDKTFYAAKPSKRKGRVQAMEIIMLPFSTPNDEGSLEFQLGSMKIDEQGNLFGFHQIDPPELPSTGKYQQRWFEGNIETITKQAIEARKNIFVGLGR